MTSVGAWHTGLQAGPDSERERRRLYDACNAISRMLLEQGLRPGQAEAALEMVLAGNPAQAAGGVIGAIRIPANAKAQAAKVEKALAALAAALEPQVPVSLSKETDGRSVSLRLMPWAGPDGVRKALMDSPFAKNTDMRQIGAGAGGWRMAVASKTVHGHPSKAAAREILRLNLHRTAALYMRAHQLYPPTTFTSSDEQAWSEQLLSGGTVRLDVRNGSEAARAFYEQLAHAAATDAQALAGVSAPLKIEWEAGRGGGLLVRTGIVA